MYCQCVDKNTAVDAVLCGMPVGNNTLPVHAWHVVCGGAPILNQCPYWCPSYMTLFWYVLSMYWYVLVCTIIHFLYQVRTIFPEYVLGTYWYVLCLQKYCSGCCFMWYACGKQYSACVTCMRWCSNTESVPLLVSNIHDIILVHTYYYAVRTGMYWSILFYISCTCLYRVRTSTY